MDESEEYEIEDESAIKNFKDDIREKLKKLKNEIKAHREEIENLSNEIENYRNTQREQITKRFKKNNSLKQYEH